MSKIIASKKMGKKTKLAIVVGVVIVVLAAGAAFLIFTPIGKSFTGWVSDKFAITGGKGKVSGGDVEHSPDDKKYTDMGSVVSDAESNPVRQSAVEAIEAGDRAGAESVYEESIASTELPEDKALRYMELSSLFLEDSSRDTSKALQYALEAEKAYPDIRSAGQLVMVYGAMDNQPKVTEWSAVVHDRNDKWKNFKG